ncbi:hypothetical protein PV04_10630 [Phialophora macrospora]|uniref:Transcription factor domain-containing protein n=1 Tax=Phialophora macrospora TaxID=1851006 RepID=A0A0D2DJC5_9EURO|nr:hypothetical protein PV04_10630 [Phialophora macrospora]
MRNDVLMHTVLAWSGRHLSHLGDASGISCPESTTTWTHYAVAIRQLKYGITKLAKGDDVDISSHMLSMLLLCLLEAISDDDQCALYHHLRAANPLISSFLSVAHMDAGLRTLVIELYLYLSSVANITLNAYSDQRVVNFDRDLFTLCKLHGSDASGVSLGCAHDLFDIIPQVSELALLRLHEQRGAGHLRDETAVLYKELLSKIMCWEPVSVGVEDPGLTLGGQILQQGLLVFLYSSFYCHDVGNTEFQILIQQSEGNAAALLRRVDFTTPSTTILVWPLTILGSCARDFASRNLISATLRGIYQQFELAPPKRALGVLELLWEDPTVFGLLGLEQIMLRNNIILGVA